MTATVGCYTTTRATGGRVWHAHRHARRLVRGARLLELGAVDPEACLRAFEALAAESRDDGRAVVRLEVRRSADGPKLHGSWRAWGDDPPVWRAATAPVAHPGATPTSSIKSTDRALYDAALAAARAVHADDALLFDRSGFLVEGARTNLVAVRADGALLTPPLARGCVAGVAREILFERVASLQEADLGVADVHALRELIAVNAVRGARAISHLDERPIGDARPGAWAAQLDRALEDHC